MNVLCTLDVHLRRWRITLADGRTRCDRCGAEWPWKVWTTEQLFPGVADWLDRDTKGSQ